MAVKPTRQARRHVSDVQLRVFGQAAQANEGYELNAEHMFELDVGYMPPHAESMPEGELMALLQSPEPP